MANDPSDRSDDLDSLDDGWDLDDEEEEAAPSTRAVDTAELLRLSNMSARSSSSMEAAKASDAHRRPTPFVTDAARHDVDTSPPPAPVDYASTIQRSKAPPMADNPTPLAFAAIRPEAYRDSEPEESYPPPSPTDRSKTPQSGVDAVPEAAKRPPAEGDDDNLSSLGSALDLDLGDLSAPPPPPSSKVRASIQSPGGKKPGPTKSGGLGLTAPKAAKRAVPRPAGLGLTAPKSAPKPAPSRPGELGLTPPSDENPATTRSPLLSASTAAEKNPAKPLVALAKPAAPTPLPASDDDFADLEVDVVLDRVSQIPPTPAPPAPAAAVGADEFPEIEVAHLDDLPDIEIDGDTGESIGAAVTAPPSSAGAPSVTDFPLVTLESPSLELDEGELAGGVEAPSAELDRSGDLSDEELQPIEARFAVGDYSGALILSEGMLEEHPTSPALIRYVESCQDMLRQMYLSRLGQGSDVPRVVMAPDQLRWLTLDHRVGFLLSCLDGTCSIDEVLDVAMMPPLEALRTLYELVQEGVIEIASDTPS